MTQLAGKVALVTGSTKGIGRSIAEALVSEGARVIVHGRDAETVKAAQQDIAAESGVFGDLGVTVNSLLPGPTWTAGVESYFEGLAEKENRPIKEVIDGYFHEHEPTSLIQRFVTADEVSQAAVFVAQNGAANGSALRIEGGIIRST